MEFDVVKRGRIKPKGRNCIYFKEWTTNFYVSRGMSQNSRLLAGPAL